MKIWSILATILLIVFLGVSAWLYLKNNDLKTQLSAAQNQSSQANAKIAKAQPKVELLALFFTKNNDPNMVTQAEVLVNKINDATITADFQAFKTHGQNADPTKMFQDILASETADLK